MEVNITKSFQMKKQFTSISNDTLAQSDPSATPTFRLPPVQSVFEPSHLNQIQQPPKSVVFRIKTMEVCRLCSKQESTVQKLILPCKCMTSIHVQCLQEIINQTNSQHGKNSNIMKCKKCKAIYSIRVEKGCTLKINRNCLTARRSIIWSFVLLFFLLGIVGLSIYCSSIKEQQLMQSHYNGNQQMVSNGNQNRQNPIKSISNTEIKTIIILLIIVLTLLEIIILFHFCRKMLIFKRFKVVENQQISGQKKKYGLSKGKQGQKISQPVFLMT